MKGKAEGHPRMVRVSTGFRSIRLHAGLWLVLMAIGVALLPALRAQLSRFLKTKGFKFVEYYDSIPGLVAQTNQVKNLLTGAEGQYLTGGVVRILKSRLENYPPRGKATNLVAVSPESFFEVESHLVTSTSALQLVASDGRMTLRGWSGYQYSMTNNNLIVSNRVRGFIHESLFKTQRP